ncbi:thiopeptide-type bacteriocin biosynthesis protein [Olivibacter sp. 47]|nr:lantibiotic dehydratase [Olivibacter sp. 47]MDM8173648.1 thiopeptide-type bacteriocin biosynthesis protein [Olivibacter sp. 47]
MDLLSENWFDIPETIYVLFRVLDADENKILIESVGGSSSANLIARFANSSTEIGKIVTELNQIENELLPEKILSEINYSPHDRVSNILIKPRMREYQTSIMGGVDKDFDRNIPLSDMLVAVRNNRIIVYSKSLKKEVVPRITSAHNYRFDKTPIYRFLGDIQNYKYRKYIGFNWGDFLNGGTFLPRVQYKNVILQAARWNLKRKDFLSLIHHGKKALESFLNSFNIPRRILLLDRGDDELFIDFENDLSFETFLSEIKAKNDISFTEYLFNESSPYVESVDGPHTNQVLTFLYKDKSVKNKLVIPYIKEGIKGSKVRKKFPIGTEWLFYKIYCSELSADEILNRIVFPLAKRLLKDKIIDQWFFIRYADPNTHLRVRFHMPSVDNIAQILSLMNRYINSYLQRAIVTSIQIDTYNREIQRYKPYAIELVEYFFFNDTLVSEKIISRLYKKKNEDERWLIALLVIDQTFEGFDLPIAERIKALQKLFHYFSIEHSADKRLRHEFSALYRTHKRIISFEFEEFRNERGLFRDFGAVLGEKRKLCYAIKSKIIKNNKKDLEEIQNSILHMSMNRIFNVKQRTQEFVCYSLLLKYYVSLNAQLIKNAK